MEYDKRGAAQNVLPYQKTNLGASCWLRLQTKACHTFRSTTYSSEKSGETKSRARYLRPGRLQQAGGKYHETPKRACVRCCFLCVYVV
eukprot:1144419-Pelagomonas_calceolata.AAC.2